ncbi:hypothetical protein [Sinomicrobium soli]|uniref:hypothetical protein n=1 Tax=Sinomicrobium sp. N-1-3-6 TaxID=2219864 RepID=UPI000DCDBF2D|nr:hypothetical protein [Sinomicrobium sp. N-1-3-6]RAV29076.1 hypothetical protein DN748_09120 [Sinomicrobium sp. N-1-3-6]
MKNKSLQYMFPVLVLLLSLLACSEDDRLVADYDAPQELPSNLVPGTPLSDRILKLYDDYGIIIYTDTIGDRNYNDLVSEDGLSIGKRMPPDSAAALVYVNMIEDEFVMQIPEDKESLIFRNFYLYSNELSSGTSVYTKYDYLSYLWYNSNSDLTVGGVVNEGLDSLLLKQSFYYGLSGVLRADPVYTDAYYNKFTDAITDAEVYYWQVIDLEDAYSKGFLSDNQDLIKSGQQDFDLFAAWAATVPPLERDSLLNEHALLKQKYGLVTSMFRQEGIPLETINEAWQESKYNPKNN